MREKKKTQIAKIRIRNLNPNSRNVPENYGIREEKEKGR